MPLRSAVASAAGWALLLTLALLAAGGATSHAGGLLLGLPRAGAAALALVAVALLAATSFEHGRLALGLLPLLGLLLLAPGSAGVRALAGPPLCVPVLAAVVLVIARRGRAFLPLARRAFFPVVLLVYGVASLNVQRQVGAEGDEPHYLMVTESLLRDHDVELEQDYAQGRYRAFYRTQPTLAPHYLVRGRQGEIYSQHALGLSLLVLPAYALGGYPAASLFMALLGALLAWETRALLRLWTADEGLAEGTAWALALSPPLVHFAGLLFTEVPAALALAIGLRRLRAPCQLSAAAALGVGAVLAFVPWLNVRYLPFPALLLLYALAARPRMKVPPALALVAPSFLSVAASALYHFQLYGFFDPRRVYGRRPGFAWARLPAGLEALLFDQEFGLLVYAPLFALALLGLGALWRRAGWRDVLALLAPIAIVLATAATWRMWWGGFTPPARFLVPVVPALALLVAFALRRGPTSASALLVGWSLFLGLAAVPQPRFVHRDRDGTAPLLRAVSGAEEWTRLLPGYVLPAADSRPQRLTIVWALALAAALVASRRGRGAAPPTAWGLGAASLGLLLCAGVAGRVAVARTGGRDAVRVLGRPALELPQWRTTPAAEAAWEPDALDWGPLYEAHRFPAGATLGSRLPLASGRYRLSLSAEKLPDSTPPAVAVVPDRADPAAVVGMALASTSDGWEGTIDVPGSAAAVDLRLVGGGPLILRGVRLAVQPAAGAPGPSLKDGG